MSSNPPIDFRTAHILVIDDEPDLRTLYELTLLREGYDVKAAGNVAEARQQLEVHQFDVVITDMRLPDGLGMEIVRGIQQDQRSERCVVMTAYGSTENAVEALKAGAFDYLTKPVDLKQFRQVVASAVRGQSGSAAPSQPAVDDGKSAPAQNSSGALALARLVGNSEAMRQVKVRIARIGRGMAPVLVRGESGTGKELVARAVHACSQRSEGPFVAVNCGAIPENLLEAEFFGARKGSYTGSVHDRGGYFQAARSGTLFLDEIGDLPLAMQSKLLRAIQERSIRPIGSTQEDAVDVRIISATHKDLQAEVQAGRFRQDLYYRLNVIEIVLPPLRERRDDLPALCAALLERIALENGTPVPTAPPGMLQRLATQPLRGNVRELENLLHRAVALYDGGELQLDLDAADAIAPPDHAWAGAPAGLTELSISRAVAEGLQAAAVAAVPAASPAPLPSDLQAWLDQQERAILIRALRAHGFNRTATAASLGLSLRQIRYRIARLGIHTPGSDDYEIRDDHG